MTAANHQVVSLKLSKNVLELICYQDAVIKWRENRNMSLDNVLVTNVIYSDAKQGERATDTAIREAGATETEAIQEILTRGHVSLSTQERRRRVEEKRQEIAGFLHNNYLSNTNSVVPVARILAAMDQVVGLKIDPFIEASAQAPGIVETLEKKDIILLHPGGIEGSLSVPYSVVSKLQASAIKIGVNFLSDGEYTSTGWTVGFSVSPKGIDQLMGLLENLCKGEYKCTLSSGAIEQVEEASPGKKGKGKGKKK